MNAARVALLLAVVANLVGWFGPVVEDFIGWQAFRVALSPLWPYEQFRIQPGLLLVLSVASALTNLLFVVLAVVLATVLAVGPASRAKPVLWAAAAATLLNLHWPISMGEERDGLELGYFVWVCSFVLLALSAFLAVPRKRR
jgi:hypothetical protein